MWLTSIGVIVLGHVVALSRVDSTARALRGQIPMLGLMVAYTATSLWIAEQDIVG